MTSPPGFCPVCGWSVGPGNCYVSSEGMFHYKCREEAAKATAVASNPVPALAEGLRLALFTDATCQPHQKKTGIASLAFDITDPFKPVEVFKHSACLPYMDSTIAEHHAVVQGLEEVIDRINYRGLEARTLIVFTDAVAIIENLERMRQSKGIRSSGVKQVQVALVAKLTQLRELGCETTIEKVPRTLNRKAHNLAHVAAKGSITPAVPVIGNVEQRFPFLKILNSNG